jgi:hypothetical protein
MIGLKCPSSSPVVLIQGCQIKLQQFDTLEKVESCKFGKYKDL